MEPNKEIHRVAVLGLGTMGHGIAQTFALAGYEVACYDESAIARASLIAQSARTWRPSSPPPRLSPSRLSPRWLASAWPARWTRQSLTCSS